MKNRTIFLFLILTMAFQSFPLSARDGERGRGRGGGGGGGGGGRTPSMSRSARSEGGHHRGGGARQQSRQQPRQQPRQARPQESRRVMGQSRSSGRQRQASRPQSRQRVAPTRQDRPRQRSLTRTPSMSTAQPRRDRSLRTERRGNIRDTVRQFRDQRRPRADRRREDKDSLKDRFRGQRQRSDRVKDRVKRDHSHFGDWFSRDFFDSHDFHPRYHFHDRWRRWGWGDFNTWFGYEWPYPYYYDYGYPIELPVDYETYYESSPQITQYVEVPSVVSAEEEWLPLGVFATAKNEDEAAYSNMFMELAVDKQGNLAGTYYNSSTDRTLALDGYIDKATQEAFWRFSDHPDSPLISTGLFNLTQDVAPILIDFPDDGDQNWVLVRVEK